MTSITPQGASEPSGTPSLPYGDDTIDAHRASEILKVDLTTVIRWIKDGTLSGHREALFSTRHRRTHPGPWMLDEREVQHLASERSRLSRLISLLRADPGLDWRTDGWKDDDILWSNEAALLLGTDRQTVSRMIRLGQLEAERTSGGNARIRFGDLKPLLERKARRG
jgi:excisionase family DNA binding protein